MIIQGIIFGIPITNYHFNRSNYSTAYKLLKIQISVGTDFISTHITLRNVIFKNIIMLNSEKVIFLDKLI